MHEVFLMGGDVEPAQQLVVVEGVIARCEESIEMHRDCGVREHETQLRIICRVLADHLVV